MDKRIITFICALAAKFAFAQSATEILQIAKQDPFRQDGMNTNASSVNQFRNGSASLGRTYEKTACGLNYVQATKMITPRYTPSPGTGIPCPLVITGLPPCYVIDTAFLYWTVSYNAGSSTSPSVSLTNPSGSTSSFTAVMTGQDGPKCWYEIGSRGFRADVTSAIAGNGTYTINSITGNTPWEVDGATLLIIYKNTAASWKGTMIIDDGIDTYDTYTSSFSHTMTGFSACGPGTLSKAFLIASDLQNNIDTTFTVNINGVNSTFPKMFYNFCEVNTAVPAGMSSVPYDFTQSLGECFSFSVAGLYFQTTTCGSCSSSSLTLSTTETPASCSACNGTAMVTPAGGTPPYSYSWTTSPVQTTQTATGLCAGTYTVSVTDFTGCIMSTAISTITAASLPTVTVNSPTVCGGQPANLIAGGATAYTWSAGATATGINTATASPLITTTYTVTGAISGCSNTAVATVTVGAPLPLTVNSPSVCTGQTATLIAGGASGYSWSAGATPTGINTADTSPASTLSYTVTETTSGCSGTAVALVIVNPFPVITINSSPACTGQPATLSAAGASVYNWLTGASGSTTSVTPVGTTTYTVTGSTGGCSSTASVTLSPLPSPVVAFSSDIISGCSPLCVNFSDASATTSGSIVSWNWNFNDGTSVSQDPGHCFQNSGVYTVSLSVTSSNGCSASFTNNNMITVFDHPVAEFVSTPNPASTLEPGVQFYDHSTPDVNSWSWDFGDGGSAATDTDPFHTYPGEDPGVYTVQLIVQNVHGCYDTVQHDVVINPEFAFYAPNAFTPDDDGTNDQFNGKGVGISIYDMWIFDRWGNMIFHSNALDKNWDGKANSGDTVAQMDVYVWKVKLTDVFERPHSYMGTVTLVK